MYDAYIVLKSTSQVCLLDWCVSKTEGKTEKALALNDGQKALLQGFAAFGGACCQRMQQHRLVHSLQSSHTARDE